MQKSSRINYQTYNECRKKSHRKKSHGKKVTDLGRKKSHRKKSHKHKIFSFSTLCCKFLLLPILLKLFLFWMMVYILIINFQSCLDESNASLVLNLFSGSLFEACSSAQHVTLLYILQH